jgi:hypothetical protein
LVAAGNHQITSETGKENPKQSEMRGHVPFDFFFLASSTTTPPPLFLFDLIGWAEPTHTQQIRVALAMPVSFDCWPRDWTFGQRL